MKCDVRANCWLELLEKRQLFSGVLPGDANYDARVDGDDYFAIDSNFNRPGVPRTYVNGDFNRDGRLDVDDYVVIDGNVGKTNVDVTGLTNASLLVKWPKGEDFFTTHDGQIIENLDFDDSGIFLLHDNVIVRNCRFRNHQTPFWAQSVDVRGIVVQRCDISWKDGVACVGRGVSFIRNYVHSSTDQDFARNPGECVWESNYFEDTIHTIPGNQAHLDIIQWFEPGFTVGNMTIWGNYFDSPTNDTGHNAVIFNNAGVTNISIEENYFSGSTYQIRTGGGPGVSIRRNVFANPMFNAVLYFGTPADFLVNLDFDGDLNAVTYAP